MQISEIDYQIKQSNKAFSAYMKAKEYAMANYYVEERCRLQAERSKILNCK